MFWAEAIGRTVEVPREILHRMDIGTNGVLSVVATLELVQHQLPKMGHSDLLVTPNLHAQQCCGRPCGSVRRASGLVQTRLSLLTRGWSATLTLGLLMGWSAALYQASSLGIRGERRRHPRSYTRSVLISVRRVPTWC